MHEYTIHTSLLFRGYECNGSSFSTSDMDYDALTVLNEIKDSPFYFVRNEPDFMVTEKKLTEYAGEWHAKG